MSCTLHLLRAQGLVVLLAAVLPAQRRDDGRAIHGAVRAPDGAAIVGAQVRLLDAASAGARPTGVVTGDDGAFRLVDLQAGTHQLAIRRIGFRAETLSVEVPMPPGGGIVVPLEPLAVSLAPVTVRGIPGQFTGPFREFQARRARGFGAFLTREDIERRRAYRTSDLLRGVANVQVEREDGRPVVRMRGRKCDPLVWVDRLPLVGGFPDLDAIAPNTLEGVEVYSGVSTIPPDLIGPRDAGGCGVIVIWTRHGERPAARSAAPAVVHAGVADLVAMVDAAALFTADQVDSMAAPLPGTAVVPLYPDSLREARIEGRALAEFVVDTLGRIEAATIGIVSATHPAFGAAVARSLVAARFSPAVRQGRVVRQLVQMPVRFAIGEPPAPER